MSSAFKGYTQISQTFASRESIVPPVTCLSTGFIPLDHSLGFMEAPINNPSFVKSIFTILLTVLVSAVCAQKPDSKIGRFQQKDSSDCFFLASLLAMGNDPEGLKIVNSLVRKTTGSKTWQVTFPSYPENTITVNDAEIRSYKLSNPNKQRVAKLANGDDDIRILEIAADRVWLKRRFKKEGLWDDVPMNAFFMFLDSTQHLIWNRGKASKIATQDVEKYKRLPKDTVRETQVRTTKSARKTLKDIVTKDTDGISMVLLDYKKYHAVTIVEIDFEANTYSSIDPLKGSENVFRHDLKSLTEGMAQGVYAVNYLEIK